MEGLIQAPQGGFNVTTTFVSGVDRDGVAHEYGTDYIVVRANAATVKGDVVSWVDPTATVPMSITPMPTASGQLDFAGIAMEGASAAGKYIKVAVGKFALVNVAAQTSAAGEYLIKPTTTAGKGIRSATAIDATTVAGTILGRFAGIKDATSTLALCYIKQF